MSCKNRRNATESQTKARIHSTEDEVEVEATYVELWEVGENLREAVVVVLLRELHLAHVKMSDAVNLVMFVDDCGRLPLRFG